LTFEEEVEEVEEVCQEEKMVVSKDALTLPRFLHFGSVHVGQSRSQVLPIASSLATAFEFEITLKHGEGFDVSPMKGSIPPGESIDIVVTYHAETTQPSFAMLCVNGTRSIFPEVQVHIAVQSQREVESEGPHGRLSLQDWR